MTTLARGGAQATVLSSADMADRGIEVTVLAGPDDPGEGTHWEEAGAAGVRLVQIPRLRRAVSPTDDARALHQLIRWLRAARPHVVHTHSGKAGALGRLAARAVGIPAVHTVHGWSCGATGRRQPVPHPLVVVERALAPCCEALVVVTPQDAEVGLRHGIGNRAQYRVIRSGIELAVPRSAAAQRDAIRAELGLGDQLVIGTIARLSPQKDVATLVAGFDQAALAEAVLVVVGDGPLRPELEAEIDQRRFGDRVRLLGRRHDAARLVAAFDLFALTSRWEGLPRTVIEAMAAGVPVVATPVGGVAEVVRPAETGTLVPVGRPDAVATAIRTFAADPVPARAMARQAAESVDEFDVEVMRDRLAELWCNVAGFVPARSTTAPATLDTGWP